jgi:hypothetical protein
MIRRPTFPISRIAWRYEPQQGEIARGRHQAGQP